MIQKQKNIIIDGCEIKKGFTLIEILVVIGIIAVLAAVILVAINPARQFKLARDSQRISNITAILNAIGQNLAENKGMFICNGSKLDIPTVSTIIKSGEGGFDLAPCVVPTYISSLPFDPSASGAKFVINSEYDTEYYMYQDTLGRIIISANGEITQNLSVTR